MESDNHIQPGNTKEHHVDCLIKRNSATIRTTTNPRQWRQWSGHHNLLISTIGLRRHRESQQA
jgi:hypothetical protein